MSASSLRAVEEDDHTAPMDRRVLPSPLPPRPSFSSLPAASSGAFAVPAPFTASGAYAAVMHASLEDTTRPSIRRKRQVSAYRRLTIALAVGLAFAAGVATTLGVMLVERTPGVVFVQAPRDAITRSEGFATNGATLKAPSAAPSTEDVKREARPRLRRLPDATTAPQADPD